MSQPLRVDSAIVARLHAESRAARWGLTPEQLRAPIEASVAHGLAGKAATPGEIERYVSALHVEDLVLASACAAGLDAAWEEFIRTQRPGLYRAADAIDPTGGARDLADALYADLFGLKERQGTRQSLFRYFHGRSSLATWLRAVLAQRHIDRVRTHRKLEPLPDDESSFRVPVAQPGSNPEHPRFVDLMRRTLSTAVAALAPRDRLRLGCYYAQDLTLAAIGRMLGEHEATVSRHLTRTRHAIRDAVESQLRREHGLDSASIDECFRSIVDDPGSMDLAEVIGDASARKNLDLDRSKG